MTELSCYYSLSSPWAYFGGPQLQDIVRRHRVQLVLKPYDFQEVVPRTGGVPLRTRPEPRRTYHAQELDRWRKYLGMPLTLVPKHYPQDGKPGIFVGAILSFIFSWNNFIFAVILAGKETRTLPVAIYNVLTFEQISWGPLAAAALLVTAPVLIVTIIAQKQIVAGLTAGGLKDG